MGDGDSYPDSCDNCPEVYNVHQNDDDSDNYGNLCDNCPGIWNESQSDTDADSIGDSCDNCPLTYNPDQLDSDQDYIGDVCDTTCDPPVVEFNIDTIQPRPDCEDLLCIRFSAAVPFTNTWTWDFGDGTAPATGDFVIHDFTSYGVFTVRATVEDSCGWTDSLFPVAVFCDGEVDTDGDGWPDECDNCIQYSNPLQDLSLHSEWRNLFPEADGFANVMAVQPLAGGRYLVAGRPTSDPGCCFRLWCLDLCGDTAWNMSCISEDCGLKAGAGSFTAGTQRSNRADWPHMERTLDTTIIVVTNAWDHINLMEIDQSGRNVLWTESVGSQGDVAFSVQESPYGGFVIGAISNIPSDGVMIIKTDQSGHTQWTAIIEELWPAGYYYMDLKPTSDGGYIYASDVYSTATYDDDVIVAKLDGNCNVVWQTTWDAGGDEYATKVIETPDGGFVVGGWTRLPEEKFFLIKFDASGSLLWERFYTVTDHSRCYDTRPTSDGGFLMVGTGVDSVEYERQFYVVKTDENGLLQWQQMFDGNDGDFAHTCAETFDGGFIIGGAAPDGSNNVGMVVKMMPPEHVSCCVGIRGNVDGDPGDAIDVSDLVMLCDYMFSGGEAPPCWAEANIDGSCCGPDGVPETQDDLCIADLVMLCNYMYSGGPAPEPCP